ncbi:MAG TPA: hypothetical protein VGF39_10075 [Stellaceae bacterium]
MRDDNLWRRNTSRARSCRNPASTPSPTTPAHAEMPYEVTVIKGRRFPTCRHCKGITFELAHAAKHVGEIDHFEEAHAPA